MHASSLRWSHESGWSANAATITDSQVQLLLAFGPASAPPQAWFDDVALRWPSARLVYITAGGQIDRSHVFDAQIIVTALGFETGRVRVVAKEGAGQIPCDELGRSLAAELARDPELRHVMVFTDGLHLNGAAFARGLGEGLPAHVTASGGLASDGTQFAVTGVGVDGPPRENLAVAIAFCGDSIVVGTGTAGGWVPFGPERTVTSADGPVLNALDRERALDIYRRYLGGLAAELPGSALLFPLSVTANPGEPAVVRTILGIDEEHGSLRFAGDVPLGAKVRLMRSTSDQLLDGASNAARAARNAMDGVAASAMICISCVGRRAVLKSRIDEEVDEVAYVAGTAVVSGYYSNGEIAPPSDDASTVALLHNQTMTVTAIGER